MKAPWIPLYSNPKSESPIKRKSGAEVLLALNTWCLAEGIALLEDFKLSHPDQLLACLRLQAEVYFSQNRYEAAWMLLDQILCLDPQD